MTETPTQNISKTLSWGDLREPGVAPVYADLRGCALRLGMAGTRFAVNGILKRRLWVRRAKMWEYARGLAVLASEPRAMTTESKDDAEAQRTQRGAEGIEDGSKQAALRGVRADGKSKDNAEAQRTQRSAEGLRVIDFGGGATLPIFYLAERGAEVLCLDVDAALADWTNSVARQRAWKLEATTHDLTQASAPAEWGAFDAAISFSVLEHIPAELQAVALARLAGLLRPGGVMALTFDYGSEAAQPFAIRDEAGVARLVAATGLQFLDARGFVDTGERFLLDKRHKTREFTFASLMLRK